VRGRGRGEVNHKATVLDCESRSSVTQRKVVGSEFLGVQDCLNGKVVLEFESPICLTLHGDETDRESGSGLNVNSERPDCGDMPP
jgi:hypothetical protein